MRNPSLPLAAAALWLFAAAAQAAPTPTSAEVAAAQFKIELSPAERAWLNDTELRAYEGEMGRGPTNEQKPAIVAKYRAMAGKNMTAPEALRYKNLVTRGKGADVDAYLDGIVLLNTEEHAKLANIKKGVGVGVGLRVATAQQQYDDEMRLVQKNADGRPKFGEHDHAHRIVNEYRYMIYRVEHPSQVPRRRTTPTQSAGPAVVDGTSLTGRELSFLPDADAAAYATASKAKHTAAEYQDLDTRARASVATKMGSVTGVEAANLYRQLLSPLDKDKIDAYLVTLAALSDSEVADLEKITKDKAPAGVVLRGANAKLDYQQDYRVVRVDVVSHVPLDNETAHAAGIVAKYRAMLKAAASNPSTVNPSTGTATNPVAGSAPLLKRDQLGNLSDADYAKYRQEYGAVSAGQQQAVNDKYLGLNDQAKKPAAPTFDYSTIKSVDDFNTKLSTSQKSEFCAQLSAPQVAATTTAGQCSNALADANAGVEACNHDHFIASINPDKDAKDETAYQAWKVKCMQGINACQTPTQQTTQTTPPASKIKDPGGKLAAACKAFQASLGGPGGPTNMDGPDSGKKNPKDVPSPTNSEKKDDAKKTDWDAFANNMTAGVAGGLFGLLLGSFFGPIGMAVGAAAFGAGAYALNAYANKKDDDKK